jgi:hypothetical protein
MRCGEARRRAGAQLTPGPGLYFATARFRPTASSPRLHSVSEQGWGLSRPTGKMIRDHLVKRLWAILTCILVAGCSASAMESRVPSGQAPAPTTQRSSMPLPSSQVSPPQPVSLPPDQSASPLLSHSPAPTQTERPGVLHWDVVLPGIGSTQDRLNGLVAWAGGFASVEIHRSRASGLWLSADGRTWSRDAMPFKPDQFDTLVFPFSNGLALVDVRESFSVFDIWYSTDGHDWKKLSSLDVREGASGARVLATMYSLGDRLVALGGPCPPPCSGGSVDLPLGSSLAASAMSPATAAHSDSTDTGVFAWWTADGRKWTKQRVTGIPDDLLMVLGSDDALLLGIDFGQEPVHLLRSSDGIAWHDVATLPGDVNAYSPVEVVPTPTGYVLAADTVEARGPTSGNRLTIWSGTANGKWTEKFDAVGQAPESAAASGSTVVIGGEGDSDSLGGTAFAVVSVDGGATFDVTGVDELGQGCPNLLALTIHLVVAGVNCGSAGATIGAATVSAPSPR